MHMLHVCVCLHRLFVKYYMPHEFLINVFLQCGNPFCFYTMFTIFKAIILYYIVL